MCEPCSVLDSGEQTSTISGIRNQPLLHFFHKEFVPSHAEPSDTPPQHSNDSKITLQGKQVEVNGVEIRFHRYVDLVTTSHTLLTSQNHSRSGYVNEF